MKRVQSLIVGFFIVAFPTSIAFAENTYIGVQAGIVFLEDSSISVPGIGSADLSTDPGLDLGIQIGQKFPNFRLEGAIDYRTNDLDELDGIPSDGDFTSLSFMLNAYYDMNINPVVTPYLGAGVGVSQVSLDWSIPGIGQVADDDDIVFAYQLAAGIAFAVTPNTVLDVGYRYFATADPSFSDVTGFGFDGEYSSHNFLVGARFYF